MCIAPKRPVRPNHSMPSHRQARLIDIQGIRWRCQHGAHNASPERSYTVANYQSAVQGESSGYNRNHPAWPRFLLRARRRSSEAMCVPVYETYLPHLTLQVRSFRRSHDAFKVMLRQTSLETMHLSPLMAFVSADLSGKRISAFLDSPCCAILRYGMRTSVQLWRTNDGARWQALGRGILFPALLLPHDDGHA